MRRIAWLLVMGAALAGCTDEEGAKSALDSTEFASSPFPVSPAAAEVTPPSPSTTAVAGPSVEQSA